MRVLHVVPSFYPAICYGGPIFSLLHLCLNLRNIGCEVKVVTTDANGDSRLTKEQQRDPILDPLNVRFCHGLELLKQVAVESEWADVIHLTFVYNFPTFPTLLLTGLRRKPLVWSPRGTLQRWTGSRRVVAKAAWESCCRLLAPHRTAVHVTSQEEAAESAPRLGGRPTWVIPNGVEVPPMPPAPPNNGVLNLLFIGRLDPKKGIENLIAATAMLPRNWFLTIVGDGDPHYVAQLRSLVKPNAPVEFCGLLVGDDKYQAFAQCDVVVVPSHTENFGMVVAEALAHARPVIASQGTPWREIEPNECGLWVKNDPSSLATAIQQIAQRDCVAMGQKGREWMTRSFSWKERAQRMLDLYQYMLRA